MLINEEEEEGVSNIASSSRNDVCKSQAVNKHQTRSTSFIGGLGKISSQVENDIEGGEIMLQRDKNEMPSRRKSSSTCISDSSTTTSSSSISKSKSSSSSSSTSTSSSKSSFSSNASPDTRSKYISPKNDEVTKIMKDAEEFPLISKDESSEIENGDSDHRVNGTAHMNCQSENKLSKDEFSPSSANNGRVSVPLIDGRYLSLVLSIYLYLYLFKFIFLVIF